MFRIGEFSKMAKVTIKTLRYYDEEGLLKPEAVDKFTGYRMYTSTQLLKLHRIQSLRQIGISIDKTKQILDGQCDLADVLEERKSEILSEYQTIQESLSRIEFILSGREEKEMMKYQAVVKELPQCIVYSAKRTLPSYDAYFEVAPALGEKLMKKYPQLKCATPEYCFVKYLDGEYKEKDIHIEFCEAVDRMEADFEDITFKRIESVPAVCVMHKGPYSTIGKAYAYLMKWIEENGYTMAECPRESYIDGIWNKDSEEDWLTELQIPIVKTN